MLFGLYPDRQLSGNESPAMFSRNRVHLFAGLAITLVCFLVAIRWSAFQPASQPPQAIPEKPPAVGSKGLATANDDTVFLPYTAHLKRGAATAPPKMLVGEPSPPEIPEFDLADAVLQAEREKFDANPTATERWLIYDQGRFVKAFDTITEARAETAARSRAGISTKTRFVGMRRTNGKISYVVGEESDVVDFLKRQ